MMVLVIYLHVKNQHVKKVVQNSAITAVDSSVSVSLKTLIEQQASVSSNIDKDFL